jgi:rod shape-determining protein MreC
MQLFNTKPNTIMELDTTNLTYEVYTAEIIKNKFNSKNNYITLNRGSKHGLKQDMGVITSKGILGIVEHTSSNFATVQSILNTKSNINAKIANSDYFGSLTWNSLDFNIVQLQDIPRTVSLAIGDTIVTGAMSSIFPENIPIGVIETFKIDASNSYYQIQVRLLTDMTSIKQVYIIYNKNRPEILKLESLIDVE